MVLIVATLKWLPQSPQLLNNRTVVKAIRGFFLHHAPERDSWRAAYRLLEVEMSPPGRKPGRRRKRETRFRRTDWCFRAATDETQQKMAAMLSPPPTVRIYLYLKSIDMRRRSLRWMLGGDTRRCVRQAPGRLPDPLCGRGLA